MGSGLGCGIAKGGGDDLVEEVVGEAVLEVIGWVRRVGWFRVFSIRVWGGWVRSLGGGDACMKTEQRRIYCLAF